MNINSETMNDNVIQFPKSKINKNSQKNIAKREKSRKIMAANAIVESMSRKFIHNMQHYDLDECLDGIDEKILERDINVMLSIIQCVTYRCIGEKHPLDELSDMIVDKLNGNKKDGD